MKSKNYVQPSGFQFYTRPYAHQKIAFDYLRANPKAGLLMEMGTGKTKVVIDYLSWRRDQNLSPDRVLWIAPNSILEKEDEEFRKHTSPKMLSDNFRIAILRGTKQRRLRILNEYSDTDCPCTVVITNYESLRSLLRDLILWKPNIVILDESSRIKNGRAQQSKACHLLGRVAQVKVIMTGTPVTQSPADIFSQYKFLDPLVFGESFIVFRYHYLVMGGFKGKQVVGYKNIEELNRKVYSRAIRFTKAECLDLPPKIYKVYRYDLTPEQARVYKDLAEELVSEFQKGLITVAQAVVKIIRFSQICSGFVGMDPTDESPKKIEEFSPNPKLELLKDILGEIRPHKLVIWCRYIHEIELLRDYFRNIYREIENVITFYGATPKEDRMKLVNDFNKSEQSQVFIGQIRTGGLGIDLIGSDKVIYFSNTYSLEDRIQSEDRCHRIGQTKKVLYIDLIGRGTIEESVMRVLNKKQNLADIITRTNISRILQGDPK